MRDVDRLAEKGANASRNLYREAVALTIEGSVVAAAPAWRTFAAVYARTHLLATLSGKADVWDATRAAAPRGFVPPPKPTVGVVIDTSFGDFVTEEFTAAVNRFQTKVPRLATDINRLAARSRQLAEQVASRESKVAVDILAKRNAAIRATVEGSFWVSDVDIETTRRIQTVVADAVRGAERPVDGRLPDFIDKSRLAGARNLTDARLETVYRTNMNAAHSEARAETLRDRDVGRVMPLVKIVEIRDRVTRGAPGGKYPGHHWQMHGYINTIEEVERLGLVPPNGYNCRGQLRGVPRSEARRLGLLNEQGQVDPEKVRNYNGERNAIIANGLYPDPGFSKYAVVSAAA